MRNIFSTIKTFFSKKKKQIEVKPEQTTQVILFDCVNSEPFNSGDELDEEDLFEATELARHIN